MLLNAVCLATTRFINNICDTSTTSTRINEPYLSHAELPQASLASKSVQLREVALLPPSSSLLNRSVAGVSSVQKATDTVYLKILYHICIGKAFYFYQVMWL